MRQHPKVSFFFKWLMHMYSDGSRPNNVEQVAASRPKRTIVPLFFSFFFKTNATWNDIELKQRMDEGCHCVPNISAWLIDGFVYIYRLGVGHVTMATSSAHLTMELLFLCCSPRNLTEQKVGFNAWYLDGEWTIHCCIHTMFCVYIFLVWWHNVFYICKL